MWDTDGVRALSVAAWLIAIALAAWGAARLLVGDWVGFAVLAGTAAAIAAFLSAADLPPVFDLIAALTGLVNAGAYVAGLWELPYYDEAVHTFTGFAVSSVFAYVLAQRPGWRPRENPWAFPFAVVAFGIVARIVWEVLECFVLNLQWWDTATDLVADTIGAIIAAIFVAWREGAENGHVGRT